jgi:nudix motif 8
MRLMKHLKLNILLKRPALGFQLPCRLARSFSVSDLHIPLTDRTTEKRRKAIHMLVTNFPAPKLASALLEREVALARAAELLRQGRDEELRIFLDSFRMQLLPSSTTTTSSPDLPTSFSGGSGGTGGTKQGNFPTPQALNSKVRESLSRHLARLPREYVGLGKPLERRASVVLPLCHHNGVPSIVFTRRSSMLNKQPGDICFPGGMVDQTDESVVGAALRELEEEVGVVSSAVDVLGVLRCDWTEMTAVTGVAVTPVIGFIQDDVSKDKNIVINPTEVDSWFSISLEKLADPDNWSRKPYHTPVFIDEEKHAVVWGLTAYILDRFMRKALRRSYDRTGVAPGIMEHEVRSLVRSEINRQVDPIKTTFSEPDHRRRWSKYQKEDEQIP